MLDCVLSILHHVSYMLRMCHQCSSSVSIIILTAVLLST